MDKEILNGIPEEEIKKCSYCGKNDAADGSDYCETCEAALLKRKLPVTGIIVSSVAILMSAVLAAVFMLSGPVLTLFTSEGDGYAREKVWYAAYESYHEDYRKSVDKLNVINDFLNKVFETEERAYVNPGLGIRKKMVNVVANLYGPLDAYYYATGFLTEKELAMPFMKNSARLYQEFQSTYLATEETFNKIGAENADYKAILAEMDTYKGKEGVNDVFLAYQKYVIAVELGASADEQLELVREIEKTASASGEDYSWLCNPTMAQALYEAGELDETMIYLDKLIEKNESNEVAYRLKMKIQVMNGDVDGAEKTVAEFRANHENCELTYYADVLEIQYLRYIGEYDKALALCVEADESYKNVPETNGIMDLTYMMENKLIMPTEFYRQRALVSMIKGDYEQAYTAMFEAYQMESYYSQYLQGVTSLNDPNFYGTLYLSAYLYNQSGEVPEEMKPDVEQIITTFSEGKISDKIEAVKNGEKTVEEVLKEGDFELV